MRSFCTVQTPSPGFKLGTADYEAKHLTTTLFDRSKIFNEMNKVIKEDIADLCCEFTMEVQRILKNYEEPKILGIWKRPLNTNKKMDGLRYQRQLRDWLRVVFFRTMHSGVHVQEDKKSHRVVLHQIITNFKST